MHGHFALDRPLDHLSIVILERVANIHKQDQSLKALSQLQVALKLLIPLLLYLERNFGKPVTR